MSRVASYRFDVNKKARANEHKYVECGKCSHHVSLSQYIRNCYVFYASFFVREIERKQTSASWHRRQHHTTVHNNFSVWPFPRKQHKIIILIYVLWLFIIWHMCGSARLRVCISLTHSISTQYPIYLLHRLTMQTRKNAEVGHSFNLFL